MHYKRYAESYERKYFPSNNNFKFVRADSSLNEKFTNWTKTLLRYSSFPPNNYDYESESDLPCSPLLACYVSHVASSNQAKCNPNQRVSYWKCHKFDICVLFSVCSVYCIYCAWHSRGRRDRWGHSWGSPPARWSSGCGPVRLWRNLGIVALSSETRTARLKVFSEIFN